MRKRHAGGAAIALAIVPAQYLPLPFPLLYIRFLPGIPYERRIKTEHVIVIHQVTAADFMDAADAVGDAVAVDMEFVADFLNIAVQPYIGYGRIGQLGVSALCDKEGKRSPPVREWGF